VSQTTPAGARTGTASWPRRILALFVDWTACNLVLVALMGPQGWSDSRATGLYTIGLFILVGAVVKAGIIGDLATGVLSLTGGRTDLAALMVLWMSGFISAIVDNIPYTVTMVPLIQALGQNVDREPLIWALALGANLGGNATIVGASANVVVASMSEARGHPITFVQYLRYGVPATLATMAVATIDIWLRYLVLS